MGRLFNCVECKKKRMVPQRGDSMRPKPGGEIDKGSVEWFYATEAGGKRSKRVRREVLCDRSQRKKKQKVA